MLQVKNVKKKYITGDFEQIALNGVSLNLRDNEFVAILGPSGSGKTTLLNIIGGLDRYDSGDLIINGVSTKKYKDRDWDSYRNHTVGFVFQSYNLIPHQTVLANVELALTIGGISAKKRREMALDALEQVGLREQAHKKPNQMSGGQMQRVAIARALVNNPRILLADEPTGALDTKTSVQVMDLLKEVAKDRLVVMVTHNPELAEEYANRIVRVKDGNIVDDTNPLMIEEELPAVHKNLGKASMSLLTSFGLSLNNLMTKKGRTILTSFAGSIGIIGIALILSLSTGFQNYIDQIQEETMTSYPLTITSETADVFSAILTMHADAEEAEKKEGTLVEQQFIQSMMGSIAKNDLKSFKKHLEEHEDEYIDDIEMIKYSYNVNPTIYTIDAVDNYSKINPGSIMTSMTGSYGSMMAMTNNSSNPFSEMRDLDRFKENYELLAGDWPQNYDEMIAVVADPHQISDLLLYSLGFHDTKELRNIIQTVMQGETIDTKEEPLVITYDDLLNLDLRLINPSDLFRYNSEYGTYENMSDDKEYMKKVYDSSEVLKISGIAYRPDNENSSMSAGIFYLPELTFHVIDMAKESDLVKKQMADKDVDVFSGNRFDDESEKEGLNFEDMISIDEDLLKEAFQTNIDPDKFSGLSGLGSINMSGGGIDQEQMTGIIMESSQAVAENLESVTQGMVTALATIDEQVSKAMIDQYVAAFTVNLPDYTALMGSGMPGLIPGGMPGISGYALGEEEQPTGSDSVETVVPETGSEETGAGEEGSESGEGAGTEGTGTEGTGAGEEGSGSGAGSGFPEIPGGLPDMPGGMPSIPGGFPGGEMPNIPGMENIPTADFVLVTVDGQNMPETFKAQAFTPEIFEQMVAQMGDTLKLSPENLRKVSEEAFDIYMSSLTPNELGMVKKDELPDPSEAIQQAIQNNDALIFQEAYDMAREYTSLMVAAGMGQAVGEIMTPVMAGITESLSGLSALSGLGDMFSGGEDMLSIDTDKFAEAFKFDMDEDELSRLMESMLTGEDASYTGNLLKLGYQDVEDPASIAFYFKDFEAKGNFIDWLDAYIENAEEEQKLHYSDLTGLLMGSVETIINSVTYVLIAFVSISLIVSSIMIGIITYISVLERTKEIGILRAIGASKRNISTIFNAETFLIGMFSGVIGVAMTYLLNIPVNIVIHNVTNNPDITAVLIPQAAVILAVIATLLTMLGGLIPARSASKKDPVIALRTE